MSRIAAPTRHIACDHCGRRYFKLTDQRMRAWVVIDFRDSNPLHFCNSECFLRCCAQGGRLRHGQGELLAAFGLTARQHWEAFLTRLRAFGSTAAH